MKKTILLLFVVSLGFMSCSTMKTQHNIENGSEVVPCDLPDCPKCSGTGSYLCPACEGAGEKDCLICQQTGFIPCTNTFCKEGQVTCIFSNELLLNDENGNPTGNKIDLSCVDGSIIATDPTQILPGYENNFKVINGQYVFLRDGAPAVCPRCEGDGYTDCKTCDGSAKLICSVCNGMGKNECIKCSGTGDVNCTKTVYFSTCNICGTRNDKDAPVCSNCGVANTVYVCKKCGAEFTEKSDVCPECGAGTK